MSLDLTTINTFISREQTGDFSILSFNVSNSYEMPVSLLTSHISQFQNALTFASKLIDSEKTITDEYTRDSLFADYLKDIKQLHANELSDIQQRSTTEITTKIGPLVQQLSEKDRILTERLDQQRCDYEQQIKALQKSQKSVEAELESVRRESGAELDRELKAFRKKVAQLESDLQGKIQAETTVREQCRKEYEQRLELIEGKNKELLAMKDASLQEQKERLEKREQELIRKVHRNASSSFRGQDGEQFFADLATDKMKWVMTYTGDVDHSCDYSTVIQNVPSFVEVKNYTDTIPFKEVTKFLNDMKLHPEITFGVFVSLNTGIQKKQAIPISMDWINGNQCVMYVQSFNELDQDHVFLMIEQTARLAGIITRNILQKEGENLEANYQQRIDDAKTYISNAISRSGKLATKIKADKIQIISLLELSTMNTLNELKQQNVELTTAVQIMLGDNIEPVSDEVDEVVVAAEPKPKKKAKKVSTSTKN
jgi:hypothetical protein